MKSWNWNGWFWEFRKYLNKDQNTERHSYANPKVTVSDFGRTFELHKLESSDSGTIRCEFQDVKMLSKTTVLTGKLLNTTSGNIFNMNVNVSTHCIILKLTF